MYLLDRTYVRHQRTVTDANDMRETTEERVPRLDDDATPNHILHFLSAFHRARASMQWTTGPRLFQKFCVHLDDDHLDTWDAITANVQNQL